jgi:hypothetical protein
MFWRGQTSDVQTHMHTANISIACEKPHSYHAMNARRTACRADTTATGDKP